jgi:hypothetical protein
MTTTTSCRAILAGAAMLPAASLPAPAATKPGPIFAAIEAHRRARSDTDAAFERRDEI